MLTLVGEILVSPSRKLQASRRFWIGMTRNPATTAASAAFSGATKMPVRPSSRARNAIGKTPLTGRTGPVGLLSPHHSHTPVIKFPAFQAVAPLPDLTPHSGRTPPEETDRHAPFDDPTS